MELKRRDRDRISFFLLILGNIATALSVQTLDCVNDYDSLMVCHFDAQNCTEYNLTLKSDNGYGERYCIPKQCESGQCCCSFNQMMLIIGETHTAMVLKGGKHMESKVIDIRGSIKPKTPTITSIRESNGNYQIMWKTHHTGPLDESLHAEVTYHKKGDTKKVSKFVKPSALGGLYNYEILGRELERSTTYAVSVKSYTNRSGKFSDSSEELEFTTHMSSYVVPLAILISLSVAAVIISVAVYVCYAKVKSKWWDTVAKCPNKLLIMHPSEQEILKPMPPIISSICVEPHIADDSKPWSKGSLGDTSSGSPQQSSGISTGSSCLSYAHTEPADIIAGVQDALVKAFPNISPISPLTTISLNAGVNKDSGLLSSSCNPCDVRADDMSSGSSCFDNVTYSIFIPSVPHEMMTSSSEVQTQAEMLCDSAYRPSAGDDVTFVDQQAPACLLVNSPPVVSSLMPTDMSYQKSNADLGGSAYAEDFSLSSSLSSTSTGTIASCDPVSTAEVGCESFDEAKKLHGKVEGEIICDENPCYSGVPAVSSSFPPVDDDYQSFQNLVEQPAIVFSAERSGEEERHLNKCPDEFFTKMPQSSLSQVVPGFVDSVQGGQCSSELQRPFLSLIPADQSVPIITESGYQCV
ncbi:uncharacterized protein LOC121959163 [Plectropomus leopardus]|uniref:uncharacterized protein LOC121959163 n=1 Tax=Plectropomus leopardus TaxID=160734 RepID=UPI001C4D8BF0|nr:uncharacterized protein LOC121959163 [Plectropomus leopardus]XP_042364413.1 uncharacterized protein LOC121959163 [Plectropomus leopardus]